MSTETQPDNTAAPPTTPPAKAPEPAASSDPPKKFNRQELVKRLNVRAAQAVHEDAPAQADEPASLSPDTPQEAEQAPAKSRQDVVRERMQAKAEERARREQAEAQRQTQARQPTMEDFAAQFAAEFERDPVATAKKYGQKDTRKMLELLSRDVIAPGSVKGTHEANSDAKQAREIAERTAAFVQQRAEADFWANEDREFSKLTEDKAKFPESSRLPVEIRLRRGARIIRDLQAAGYEYDRELVADALEAELEEEQVARAKNAPKEQPKPTPSSPTSEAPKSPPVAAKTKQPTKTVTAEMTSQSGARAGRSQAQRKAELIERLQRRIQARALQ